MKYWKCTNTTPDHESICWVNADDEDDALAQALTKASYCGPGGMRIELAQEHDRLTILRCKAANARNLSNCYDEEADNYERDVNVEANRIDPEGDLSRSIVFNEYDHSGMPDDWLAIAELPLPPTKEGT